MSIHTDLPHIQLELNGTMCEFRAELKRPQPRLEMLEQIVDDFRDTLDHLDSQAQVLRWRLRLMEDKLDALSWQPIKRAP